MKEARTQKRVHWTHGARQVLGGAALDLVVAVGASVERLVEETIETTLAAYMRLSMLQKKCNDPPKTLSGSIIPHPLY